MRDIRIVVSSDYDEAKSLVERMYGWRGYSLANKADVYKARTLSINIIQDEEIQANLTIAFDGEGGLNADAHFPDEVELLRLRPHFLCEFTRLANKTNDLEIVAALFHSAFIVAYHIKQASFVIIEVHPRHANYYKRTLGFTVLADASHNKNVGAPGVLLGKSMKSICTCIKRMQAGKLSNPRSMYNHFFDKDQEAELIALLQKK